MTNPFSAFYTPKFPLSIAKRAADTLAEQGITLLAQAVNNHNHDGVNGGLPIPVPWTTWNPILSQGAGLSATVVYARYALLGKIAHIQAGITITSGGTANNPLVLSNIPVAIPPKQNGGAIVAPICGTALYNISGAGWRTIAVAAASSTTFRFIQNDFGANTSNDWFGTTAGGGVTAANLDILTLFGVYEVA